MKYCYFVSIISILLSCNNSQPNVVNNQETPLPSVSVHIPDSANNAVDSMLSAYYSFKSSLVEADSLTALSTVERLHQTANNIDFNGVADSVLRSTLLLHTDSLQTAIHAAQQTATLSGKRIQLNNITHHLYALLKMMQYHKATVFYQKCPMAFNDNQEGFWLSSMAEIENPYLGKKHPTYQSGMLHCGEVVDSIAFR